MNDGQSHKVRLFSSKLYINQMDALGLNVTSLGSAVGALTLVFAGSASSGSGSTYAAINIDVEWDIGTIYVAMSGSSWPIGGNTVYVLPSSGNFPVSCDSRIVVLSISSTQISMTDGWNNTSISCNLYKYL